MNGSQLKKVAIEAQQKWLEANFGSKKQVEAWVFDKMNKGATEIMLKLLGFDKDYHGSWKIDHCNGRSGNSVIGDFMASSCRMAVEKWAKDAMKNLPTVTTEDILRIHGEYKQELLRAVKQKMAAAAQKKAEEILAEVSKALSLDDVDAEETLELPF